MKKKELISRVAEALRENNIRKPVSVKKHSFHITDDDGNRADFHVKQQDKFVLYTAEDVANILDACMTVVSDAIKNGEEVSLKGFGTLGVHYRAARRTKEPNSGEWCEIEARYVPKFTFGSDLRMAAKLYEVSLSERAQGSQIPESDGDL